MLFYSNSSTKEPKKLKLGEIFEYEISYFDEDESKDVVNTWQCFFIKVEDGYYLINVDEGKYRFFYDGIYNFPFVGDKKMGDDPFSYLEALQFLKIRNARAIGKMAFIKKKKKSEDFLVRYDKLVSNSPSFSSGDIYINNFTNITSDPIEYPIPVSIPNETYD